MTDVHYKQASDLARMSLKPCISGVLAEKHDSPRVTNNQQNTAALALRSCLVLLLSAVAVGCGTDTTDSTSTTTVDTSGADGVAADVATTDSASADAGPQRSADDFRKPGPYAVGVRTYTITDAARGRTLTVEAVYPIALSDAAKTAVDMTSFATSTADETTYKDLLKAADKDCPTRTALVARDAKIATGKFPLVVFSHCHNCIRYSSLAILRRMASHGIIVLAPDHAGNTLFDSLRGQAIQLGKAFLTVRVADLKTVLDDAVKTKTKDSQTTLRDAIDTTRIGALGHSFGSVTAGLFTQDDKRIRAVAGIAAPMQNPLLPGVDMKKLTLPLLFILAREDNSITTLGNTFLRNNYKAAPGPAWLLEVDDAGHWSFSDIAGLHKSFDPGCGKAKRMTDDTKDFSYLPVKDAQHIAATWLTAFFSAHLDKDSGAAALLAAKPQDSRASIQTKKTP